ncbi:MAG: hypothetical protein EBR33_08260 [Synechococcaceae bacterium WB4_1_0192]|nr:hypothetical protein [Synechococcaceae bacterium WB4_1_0192]
MTSPTSPSGPSPGPTRQDQHAQRRALQALRCLPFRRRFYQELEQGALSSTQLAQRPDWSEIARRPLNVNRCEDDLIWMIQLGVLRREVDGQGLTERVRLTPLGRDLLAGIHGEITPAGPVQRLQHWIRRHRPRR